MILDRHIQPFIIYHEETIASALHRIVNSRGTIICAVDEHNILQGILTNGDFLRWTIQQKVVDLEQPLRTILNNRYVYVNEGEDPEKIQELLEKLSYIPVVSATHRLVAMARRRDESVRIDKFVLSEESPAFVIAEIGINHNGSVSQAKKLIDAAIEAGADCAKFQMRDLSTLYSNYGDSNDARENLGSQYTLDLLSRFELSPEDMFEAFDYCKASGIIPLCTPWDLVSLQRLEQYGMIAYKTASADLTNHQLLSQVARTGKPMICSTGMSDESEIRGAVNLLQNHGVQYVLLQCNSTYPAPFKDVNLRYMSRLREIGRSLVGYSGHERGISVPIAAVAMGAKVIEKHITLDRSMEGNDHKVSLLPNEFKSMVESIRQVEASLGSSSPRQITQGERINRASLAKSLVAESAIKIGETITREMIAVKSPGRGLQPNRIDKLVGQKAKRNFVSGDYFYQSDIEDNQTIARHYSFRRRWGIPVRYYDFKRLMRMSNPDFLEFHLSYKDMDQKVEEFFDTSYELDLIVHSPDLFSGDHLLNLAADDENYRQRSIHELQRVVNVTRELQVYFRRSTRPLIIASLGGFSKDGFVPQSKRKEMYARVADSLFQIDAEGVEIIGQTLPPYPWYFGGQLYLNLFVDPTDTADFCTQYGYRLCLDVSHSKLACNEFGWSFKNFVNTVGPHVAHLHIVDAAGIDREGLQIGEGEIDFPALAVDLDQIAPDASFIPEIWQGHENEGEGFWSALERLESLF